MTSAELNDLKATIKDAKAKYHLLITGQAVRVFVDQNGERMEFVGVKSADLAAYIRGLEAQLPDAPSPFAQPIGFFF